MSELKPCPFCGGSNVKDEPALQVVICMDCGAEKDTDLGEWNKRPIEDALHARIAELRDVIGDYRNDASRVLDEKCPSDERHCGCVPILRRENRLISEELADAKDELKHCRDALIDAQRIYNKANEQKVHYLSALQFIASFVNAKDKTTVDDLIAIASKEIDAEGDQIVDACNYWVSKLREAEDKLQDAQLKPKTVYTVTMYRYGNREWHSYVLGAFSSNDIAREWAAKEEEYRDGKYKAEIIRWGIDSPTDFLF